MMQRSAKRGGFTLVELMVALAVLALLIVILASVIEAASRTIRISDRRIDSTSQTRLVFSCLATDLSHLIKRLDMPVTAQNAAVGATNLLCFFSGVASADPNGNAGDRNISVIAYQVATNANNLGPDNNPRPCLIRAGKAIPWSTTGYFGLDSTGLPISFSSASFPPTLVPQQADFDVLAQGVIRMVIGFQLYPDNQPATLQDGTSVANAIGQVVYSPPVRPVTAYGGTPTTTGTSVVDLNRISSVVVGIVVIDQNNLQQLTAVQVASLESQFSVPTNDTLPVASWGATVNSPAALPSTVPLPARQALHVFQSFFPITPFASHL